MEPKQYKNYIAGIYLRLSRDDERAGESLSIENQKILVTKYVKEKGWEIKDVYVDDGYSGTNFERPGVKRLLDDAKAGEINTIVVKDLSRFGRNYILVGQYIDYVFPSFGIRFVAIQGYDGQPTTSRSIGEIERELQRLNQESEYARQGLDRRSKIAKREQRVRDEKNDSISNGDGGRVSGSSEGGTSVQDGNKSNYKKRDYSFSK